MIATLWLDTGILLSRSIDLLHHFLVGRGGAVSLVVANKGLLVRGRRETAHSLLNNVALSAIFDVCVGLHQIKDGVSVVEEVDHAGAVVNPQKVHEESDHHVLLGLT